VDEPRRLTTKGLLAGDLVDRLDRWVAELRSNDAAAARMRERWLLTQAQESSTFLGVLMDLGEQGATVMIDGRGGRRHRGTIDAVANDFCGLRTQSGRDILLTYSGIASVRPERRSTAPTGDRDIKLPATLDEALAKLVEDRPRVLVVTLANAEGVAGELQSVGRDVLTLRLDGDPPVPAYVAISAVAELSLVDR
jgi:hypothetical protein